MLKRFRSFAPILAVLAVALPLSGCFQNPTEPLGFNTSGSSSGGGGTTRSNPSDTLTTSIDATAQVSGQGIYLSVANQLGSALTASSFGSGNLEVTYNGRTVPSGTLQLGTASTSGQAISTSLVLDYSGSMATTDIADMEAAATIFVNSMQATDRGEIVKFDDHIVVEQAYTADKSALRTAITANNANYGGSTALWDAIYRGILDTATETGQRAVVAFTDGGENSSVQITSQNQLVSEATSRGIPVYTIGFSYSDPGLATIASATGGRYYSAPTSSDLAQIYSQIAQLFTNTVLISWPSFTYVSGATLTITVTYICGSGTFTDMVSVVLP